MKTINISSPRTTSLRIAIIIDNSEIPLWVGRTLNNIIEFNSIVLILNCGNTHHKRPFINKILYYFLNTVTIKNKLTKKNPIHSILSSLEQTPIINFNSDYNGVWQSLPSHVYDKLRENNINLIIKFGMGLLKIPSNLPVRDGILSFHHGNPEKYRGRPAGFYELINNETKMGVIVQKLSNEIDGGEILAFLESKVYSYSYKKTLMEAYSNSEFLLMKAISNLEKGVKINLEPKGKNYTLPSNRVVLKFLYKILLSKLKRMSYGLFYEKKWRVGTIPFTQISDYRVSDNNNSKEIEFNEKDYSFIADPFFLKDNSLLVEAFSKSTRRGEIVRIKKNNECRKIISDSNSHFSYPSVISKEVEYIMPEMANKKNQMVFQANNNETKIIEIPSESVIDPTYYFLDNIHYIFGSQSDCAHGRLYLWYSKESFLGPYTHHPMNPICISPIGGRMAGHLFFENNKLYRLGQDNSVDYGNGVAYFEIITITPDLYEEIFIGIKKLKGLKGPHTLNMNKSSTSIAYDYYTDKFNIFAGFNRLYSKYY